jgi:hypothetical protein
LKVPSLRSIVLLTMGNMYMKMSVQQWWNYIDRGEQNYRGRNLSSDTPSTTNPTGTLLKLRTENSTTDVTI